MKICFFTLLELLVVISIMAVMSAMLMPALGKARGKSMEISCSSNLRQLGSAFMMYEMDNSQHLPPYIKNSRLGHAGMNWASYTLQYYQDVRILDCPASPASHPPDDGVEALHLYDGNYGWNYDGTQGNRGKLYSIIPETSEAYLVFDSGDQCIIYGANNWDNLMEELDLDWNSRAEGPNRHSNQVNIVFVDGHVSRRLLDPFISAPNPSNHPPWYIEWEGGELEKKTIPFPRRN